MGCGGYKYRGIVFSSKDELKQYLINGQTPSNDVSVQEIKTNMIAYALKSVDPISAISDILFANYGIMPQEANQYYDYIESGTYSGTDVVSAEQKFNGYSEFLKDLESSVDYSNRNGNYPITVSTQVRDFLSKIKNTNNDSSRFLPAKQGSESSSNQSLSQLEEGKWFVEQEQTQGPETTETAGAGIQGSGINATTNANQRTGTGAESIPKTIPTNTTQRAGAVQGTGNGVRDGSKGKADTTEYIGEVNGHVQRVRIENGSYVQWDPRTKSWSGVVTRTDRGRYGFVRKSTRIENESAEQALKEITITKGNTGPLVEMVFNGGSPIDNLGILNRSGLIKISPSALYKAAKKSFDEANITLADIVAVLGSDRYERLKPTDMSSGAISKMDIFPMSVSSPMSFYRNLGLSDHIASLAEFIYNKIPSVFNKTQKGLAIALELIYPSKTGFGVFDHLPYTNEEIYHLDESYGVKTTKNYGKPFLNEYLNGEVSFGFERNKVLFEEILENAKKIGWDLPSQYEQYYAAETNNIPMYQLGDVLMYRGTAFIVRKHDYTQDEVSYVLESEKGGFYKMGLQDLDNFGLVSPKLQDEIFGFVDNIKRALSEIGVSVVGWPAKMMDRSAGIYNPVEKKIIFNIDNLSDRTKNVILHEAAHAVFINGIRIDPEKIISMHKQIAEVLKNGTPEERKIYNRINDLLKRYTQNEADEGAMRFDELMAHEFMAELVAILAADGKKITSKTERTIIQKLIDMFRDLFSWNQDLGFENINELIDFTNGLAEKLITGESISFLEYSNLSRGDENIAGGTLNVLGDDYLTPGDTASIRIMDPVTRRAAPYFTGKVVARGTTASGEEYVTFDHNKEHGKTYLLSDIVQKIPFFYLSPNAVALDGKTQKPTVGKMMGLLRDMAVLKKPDGSYVYTEDMFYNEFREDLELVGIDMSDVIEAFSNLREVTPPPPPPPGNTDDGFIYDPDPEPVNSSGNKNQDNIFRKISKIVDYSEFLSVLRTGEYDSGKTIEKKTGYAPLNPQDIIKVSLADAFEYGKSIIADAKAAYGENYVNQLLSMLNTPGLAGQARALVYMSLENDLHARKMAEPENYDMIVRLQYRTHVDSQENSRNLSLGLNYQRVRQMQRDGTVDVKEVPLRSLTPKQKNGRKNIEESVDTPDTDINDIADEIQDDTKPKPPTPPKDPSSYKLNVPGKSKDGRVKSDKKNWVVPDEAHMKELEDRIKEFIKKNC